MDFEQWSKPQFLFKVCLVLGAFVGILVGGELAAGLGAGGVILGCLTGCLAGGALGFYGAKAQYSDPAIDDPPVSAKAAAHQRAEELFEPAASMDTHVGRLHDERMREAERGPERS